MICDEDCFNCKNDDCEAPENLLKSDPIVQELLALSTVDKIERRRAYDNEYNKTRRKKR